MLFNSIDFAYFLPIVFVLYWLFKSNIKIQNLILFIASYIFYGWWEWKFLLLILLSTIIDYSVGIAIDKNKNIKFRKIFIVLSLVMNLGMLIFFKYYNFFIENFNQAFLFFGSEFSIQSLQIILPVGISFYTFQTLSYSIDVYRGNLKAEYNFVNFATYVSFFPQLVAGPIERASNLLPQFSVKREFNYIIAVEGMRQILWGLFKKMVIADNCALYANDIFNNSNEYNGSTLFLGAIFFAFQIYGDFSGYSDIAIGTSKLFGFHLMKNFDYPYFSRDIAEFWRRWHISLSTWFRDYIYIPLGGSNGSKLFQIRNVLIIFIISGFWHGANWTFIAWGILNALFFIPLLISKKNRTNIEVVSNLSLKNIISIFMTFILVVLAWILFRANDFSHAIDIYKSIFSNNFLNFPSYANYKKSYSIICLLLFLVCMEWLNRRKDFGLSELHLIVKNRFVRWFLYSSIIFLIFMFMETEDTPFIYFQF